MPSFRKDDVEIAYLDEREGEPIVLIHGFASTKEVNWLLTSWVTTLTKVGRRAIALDNRGHGASTKLYDPAAYHSAIMAEDVRASTRSSGDRTRRLDGLFDGVSHRCVSVGRASGARAVGDSWRARHSPRGRSWTSGKHRRGTRSANGCRCEGSDGARRFGFSQNKQDPTCARSRPVFAARGRP